MGGHVWGARCVRCALGAGVRRREGRRREGRRRAGRKGKEGVRARRCERHAFPFDGRGVLHEFDRGRGGLWCSRARGVVRDFRGGEAREAAAAASRSRASRSAIWRLFSIATLPELVTIGWGMFWPTIRGGESVCEHVGSGGAAREHGNDVGGQFIDWEFFLKGRASSGDCAKD